ncbi:MAG: ATP-binding protein [Chitinophagaceae bacterium]
MKKCSEVAISHKINVELSDTKIITGDRNRIGQVITNLISNAIKYSPEASDILITSVIESNKIKIVCTGSWDRNSCF